MAQTLLNSKTLTKECLKILKDKNNTMNLSISLLSENPSHKLSIVGKYQPLKNHKLMYVFLDENLRPKEVVLNNEDFYYGISPLFDASKIFDSIVSLKLRTEESLLEFIKEEKDNFKLYEGMEEYLLPFIKYSMLSLSYLYGIKICVGIAKEKEEVPEIVKNMPYIKSFYNYDKEKGTLFIHGTPTNELIEYLDKYLYAYNEEEQQFYLQNVKNDLIYDKKMSKEYFKRITLLDGYVFYSGVLLNATGINKLIHSNFSVESYEIVFEKTSYATVYAFTHDHLDHPLLNEKDRLAIKKLFCKGDKEAIALRNSFLNDNQLNNENIISIINEYLSSTYEVNQIGITGNLITNDNILILGKRNIGSIDAEMFYPGINGNCEIDDINCSFYRDSVEEDLPTIKEDSTRIDFSKELSREAYAELETLIEPNKWQYKGLCISGNANELNNINEEDSDYSSYRFAERRLHFSIIAEATTKSTFFEIYRSQKKATESYENYEMYGWKLKPYKNIFRLISAWLLSILRLIDRNKTLITTIIAAIITYLIPYQDKTSTVTSDFNSVLSIILKVVSTILAISSIMQLLHKAFVIMRKSKHHCIITHSFKAKNERNAMNKTTKLIASFLFNKKSKINKVHPTTLVALKIYSLNSVFKEFKLKIKDKILK